MVSFRKRLSHFSKQVLACFILFFLLNVTQAGLNTVKLSGTLFSSGFGAQVSRPVSDC